MGEGTVHGGGVLKRTKRVFLISGTAYEGYAVCYNFNVHSQTAEGDAIPNASNVDWCDARRVQVEVPAVGNNMHFAGVVAQESEGVVGPNWIAIHEPGSVCRIYSAVTAQHLNVDNPNPTTDGSGEVLTFCIATGTATGANGKFVANGFTGEGAAMVLESQPTASQLIMGQLLTGPPSGGVQTQGYSSDCATGSVFTWHGVSIVSINGAVSANTAIVSVPEGVFIGQTKLFLNSYACDTTLLFQLPKVASPMNSTYGTITLTVPVATELSFGSTANDWLRLEWMGREWAIAFSSPLVTAWG